MLDKSQKLPPLKGSYPISNLLEIYSVTFYNLKAYGGNDLVVFSINVSFTA